MADVNNKIRLQIVTQLDAAGIKATKDQVDQLELGLRRAGTSASGSGEKFGQFEKAIGKLPGRLGEIAGKLGGLAGQATMVFGAFSLGVEIGNKIVEFQKKVGLFPGQFDETAAAAKRYDAELANLKTTLDGVVAAEMKRLDAADSAAAKGMKAIDDQTAAYMRQATALEGLRNAQGNAEAIQLERAKFEDMRAYSDAGYTEAAEQIGKYYDVLQAELTARQQLNEFDRKSDSLKKDLTSAENAYAKAAERVERAKARQAAAEKNLADFRQQNGIGGNAMYTNETDEIRDDALEKVVERVKRSVEKAEAELEKRGVPLENVAAKMNARQLERANLAASGTLGVDRAAQAYDSYVSAYGNPLNAEIDQTWAMDLLKSFQDADQTQRELLEVVTRFADNFERALNGGD